MFTVEQRADTIERILAFSRMDNRIVGAAVVGSLAHASGDRWSDIDLTFAVDDKTPVAEVLTDWTAWLGGSLDALQLFDLPDRDTIYRVFLLPGGLQCDLSFTAASKFAAGGPRFRLIFGEVHPKAPAAPADASNLFGWAVAYARDGRALIERGKPWMAEHMISEVRNHALAIACVARGLPARFGRGYDDLPPDVTRAYEPTFLTAPFETDALRRALEVAVEGLLRESESVVPVAAAAAPRIREWLTEPGE